MSVVLLVTLPALPSKLNTDDTSFVVSDKDY